jgi:hypothetical protein
MGGLIQLGDKVRFLNENLDGTVTSLKANGTCGVTIEDGFEIDVLPADLVVVETAVKAAAQPAKAPAPKAPLELQAGLFLLYNKDEKQHWQMRILNRTAHPLYFTIYRSTPAATELIQHGYLEDSAEQAVASLGMQAADKWGIWTIQTLQLRQFPAKVPAAEFYTRRFTQGDFQQTPHRQGGLPLFAFRLESMPEETAPVLTQAEPQGEKAPFQAMNFGRPEEEVDLHSEALGIDASLPGDQILKKQMDVFQRQLELAISYKMPHITVIHGVGSGVLKNLIILALKGHKHVKTWENASELKYGQGALKIRLR